MIYSWKRLQNIFVAQDDREPFYCFTNFFLNEVNWKIWILKQLRNWFIAPNVNIKCHNFTASYLYRLHVSAFDWKALIIVLNRPGRYKISQETKKTVNLWHCKAANNWAGSFYLFNRNTFYYYFLQHNQTDYCNLFLAAFLTLLIAIAMNRRK